MTRRRGALGVLAALALAAACAGPAAERDAENGALEDGVDGAAAPGSRVAAPDEFPEDVPVYPGLSISASLDLSAGHSVHGLTDDRLEEVAAFYADRMEASGWTAKAAATQSPSARTLAYVKDGRRVSINLIPDGRRTSVQIVALEPG